MKSLSGVVLGFLTVIFGIIFLDIILTSLFIGGGYIISLVYPFPLFHATVLCVGVAFVSSFIIFIAVYNRYEDNASDHLSMANDKCDCYACTFRRELKNKKLRQRKSK